MDDWGEWIGRTQTHCDTLTPALIARFRATIDSQNGGNAAPQGIHWCLCLPDAATADLDVDGHPRRGGFLPPITLPRRMWASSTVAFHTPLKVSSNIERRVTIANIGAKQGSSGQLIFVEIDHQTSANGVLAVTERQTLVYREASTEPPAPKPADCEPDLSDWQWHNSLIPSETLLFRYSALTFNTHRIHYDRPYAQDQEHYRGLVVHGPLTATLLLDLAAREIGDNQIKHFSFRGQSPAFAGETLHIVGRKEGAAITLAALGGDGRTIMSATAI
jgi:3-methylfumaryl-CoA hydratase